MEPWAAKSLHAKKQSHSKGNTTMDSKKQTSSANTTTAQGSSTTKSTGYFSWPFGTKTQASPNLSESTARTSTSEERPAADTSATPTATPAIPADSSTVTAEETSTATPTATPATPADSSTVTSEEAAAATPEKKTSLLGRISNFFFGKQSPNPESDIPAPKEEANSETKGLDPSDGPMPMDDTDSVTKVRKPKSWYSFSLFPSKVTDSEEDALEVTVTTKSQKPSSQNYQKLCTELEKESITLMPLGPAGTEQQNAYTSNFINMINVGGISVVCNKMSFSLKYTADQKDEVVSPSNRADEQNGATTPQPPFIPKDERARLVKCCLTVLEHSTVSFRMALKSEKGLATLMKAITEISTAAESATKTNVNFDFTNLQITFSPQDENLKKTLAALDKAKSASNPEQRAEHLKSARESYAAYQKAQNETACKTTNTPD